MWHRGVNVAFSERRAGPVLTLSTVKHRGSEHLIPDHIRVPRVFTNDESPVMLLDQPTSRRSTETSGISDRSVRSCQFDENRSENSDTP